MSPIAMGVVASFNPLDPDDLILADENQVKNMDYYIGGRNEITQLNYEGEALGVQAKVVSLVTAS